MVLCKNCWNYCQRCLKIENYLSVLRAITRYCANETLTLTPALVFTLGADVEI